MMIIMIQLWKSFNTCRKILQILLENPPEVCLIYIENGARIIHTKLMMIIDNNDRIMKTLQSIPENPAMCAWKSTKGMPEYIENGARIIHTKLMMIIMIELWKSSKAYRKILKSVLENPPKVCLTILNIYKGAARTTRWNH